VKRKHLEAFAPACPVCRKSGRDSGPLIVAAVEQEQDGDIVHGVLHCPQPACQHEFPIIDGIPVIVPDVQALMAQRGVDFFLRGDLPASLESLLGDALGPDSWLDALRQGFSTYGWDAYADLAPGVAAEGPAPGAARRCLERLLALGRVPATGRRAIDVGCAAGRTSFAMAAHVPDALVLGVDTNFGLLRMARAAALGRVRYPLRRIGLVYDRQDFAVSLPGADRVDFWVMDALALPLAPGSADVVAALNVLDCVADPRRLLSELAALLHADSRLLLATPFDWSTRATEPQNWIGGHSQRAAHGGSAEAFMAAMIAEIGLVTLGDDRSFPWHTRLHARSTLQYVTCLLALGVKQALLF
jgi:SAM-dependent methyltransferase/uncharacterized protein YbaR (Trm112 family)